MLRPGPGGIAGLATSTPAQHRLPSARARSRRRRCATASRRARETVARCAAAPSGSLASCDVEESVRASGDRPHTILLMRFGVRAAQIVFVEVVHEVLDHPAGPGPARADVRDSGRRAALRGRRRVRDAGIRRRSIAPVAGPASIRVGRARRLAVIRQNIGVVAMLGYAAHDSPQLLQRWSTSCSACMRRALRGPNACAISS